MKQKNCLALLCATVLAAACSFGGYYSSFHSNSSFEMASRDVMLSMDECVDSVLFVTNDFYGSGDYAMGFAHAEFDAVSQHAKQPGFVISLQKDNTLQEGYARPFSAFSKTGGYQSFAYVVYTDIAGFKTPHGTAFTSASNGTAALEYVYVNNTNEVVNLVTFGNAEKGIAPFGPDDYLKLTITIHTVSSTRTVEVMLADYTGSELKLVKDWTKVEFTGVTGFTFLDYSVTSNRRDIPLMFCLDQLVAQVEIGEK